MPRVSADPPDPTMSAADWALSRRAASRMGPLPRGRSVLRIGGSYRTIDIPTQTEIDSATEVYLGGHIYEVSDAVYSALVGAGYAPQATTWGSVAARFWADVSGIPWGVL